MAKVKAKGRASDQKSIKAFFNRPGKAARKDDDDSDHDETVEPQDASDDEETGSDAPVVSKSGEKTKGLKIVEPDMSDLPPINQIPAIFDDLVGRIPQIKDVAEHIQGRKLRVATMCSGTESPLLALELIQKSVLDQHGLDLSFEHVFSCEIEPFKQAYIERNFHPPILFRDVCELGGTEAHTAYGALTSIPGDVDLLVAGTSCVDYSNLNNVKQGIDAKGESGQTFRGMLAWVKNHRPPIVILENVCSAPWPRVAEEFENIGYSAKFSRFDTKFYYIPHTRTRVYLVAVDAKSSKIPDHWLRLVTNDLRRQASASLDAFLLSSDDPRIHEARQKLVKESYNALDRRTGRTDWNRCERRHERSRIEEDLGKKRPLTNWDDGGSCSLPDYSWADWGVGQVERVWDLMDISFLRSAKSGIDPSYKTQVWNLSQNVDRSTGSSKVGICPCLTPSMIPYITNRGGPMVGLEALAMQGLPVDKLLLTRESEDQLADLAGNAMSTTVVGASILAALVSGMKLLKTGADSQSYESKRGKATSASKSDEMEVDLVATIEDSIVGEDALSFKPLDLAVSNASVLSELLLSAEKSARLCDCEGRTDITQRTILRCQDCGASSCTKCGGRPEHNPVVIDTKANPRMFPSEFADQLKSTLPMCLSIEGVSQELLDRLKGDAEAEIPVKLWTPWCEAVKRISEAELRFVELKRQEIWVASFESSHAVLELHLHPQQPEWRLFAKADPKEPAKAEIRQILKSPVGRLRCAGSLLSGRWEIELPQSVSVSISIQGVGDLVESWEARLGLMKEFQNKKVSSKLKVTAPPAAVEKLDRDISGVYTLLDKCGTSHSALHKREPTEGEENLPPLFLLMHPQRTSNDDDCFVFSTSRRRYAYGESRPLVALLDPKWRQSNDTNEKQVTCRIPIRKSAESMKLQASHHNEARYGIPRQTLELSCTHDSCRSAAAVLVCSIPLRGQVGSEWPRGTWGEVDKVNERSIFRSLAWVLERIRHIGDDFKGSWQEVDLPDEGSNCDRCAPVAPLIQWIQSGKKMVALEDPVEAGKYERSLKKRPSAFVTQLKLDDNGTGTVRVGLNAPTMIHRALSRLPTANRSDPPILSWRLDTKFTPAVNRNLPKFVILSNKQDKEHAQPPHFKISLRKEQLRSLEWMVQQESPDAPPFIEEEISEAILPSLGWRVEGRAQRPVRVRGGVLADAVGYGKTATTLGLIDCNNKTVQEEFSRVGRIDGKIAVKGTLVIVPPHLTRQWESEIKKFTKNHFNVIVLSTVANLNPLTIEDFQDADIIIAASTLQKSQAYADNLELLAGNGVLPNSAGRHFNARLQEISASLKAQTDRLQDEGAAAVMKEIKRAQAAEQEAAAEARIVAKRLKGRAYREAAQKKEGESKEIVKAEEKKLETPTSSAPSSSSSHRIVEVVVPLLPGRKPGKNMPLYEATPSADEDAEPQAPAPRKRRAAAKSTIILSDDEDGSASEFEVNESEEEAKPSNKSTTKGKSKATARNRTKQSASENDDDDYSAEETASEEEDTPLATSVPGSDDDESDADSEKATSRGVKRKAPAAKATSVKSKKSSAIAKPSGTSRQSAEISDSEDEKPAKKGKKTVGKRKAETDDDDAPPAKKQKKRVDSDPWKLETPGVKRDWTQMKAPPLEMFHYARKVIDEYTYLDGRIHPLITNLTAERHWVLSGTPPVHDFAALKTISAFLSLHLGVDDDGEGQSVEVKKRRREQTDAEKFHSFREVHSLEWHAHRHALGQVFLDRFVRQNVPEIDEIPFTNYVQEIILPAAERAIYLELEHHLRSMDMTIKRGRKTESDREKRLAKSLGDSKTAEEALLKRCSHFDLDASNENAMKACDVIVRERENQLEGCKAELLKAVKAGVKREIALGNVPEESFFKAWVNRPGVDDADAAKIIQEIIDEVDVDGMNRKKSKKSVELTKAVKDAIWEHREATHEIRRLQKELVGRVRSLRFFTAVRDLQKEREIPVEVSCKACGRENLTLAEISVLSSCGHMGCSECVRNSADKEECIYHESGACTSAARVLNIVSAENLGIDDEARDGRGKHYGKKLEEVIELIQKKIPKDDRVLVFVQFPDLMKKVAEALKDHHVKFLEIKGSASAKSKALDSFQNESKERVLLLNLMDESASGANLTGANHAIFLSPLLAPSQEIYDACMTQAVGRLVRFGQSKHVHIWRYRTSDTMDEEVYNQREAGKESDS